MTATRARGRLSLVLQRDNAAAECWVGKWRLMVAYQARRLDAMVMPDIGGLIVPVSAGPVRGPRFSRLLLAPKARVATRNVASIPAHRLDRRMVSSNQNDQQACNAVVNIYSRTRLRMDLAPPTKLLRAGEALSIDVRADVLQGNITTTRSFARLLAPQRDLAPLVAAFRDRPIPREARLEGSESPFDTGKLLAVIERRDPRVTLMRDEELKVALHDGGPMHVHVGKTDVPGTYHVGVYVEGYYCHDHDHSGGAHGNVHDHGATHAARRSRAAGPSCGPDCEPERFYRVLTTMVGLPPAAAARKKTGRKAAAKKTQRKKTGRRR